MLAAGEAPRLQELRLHNGTVYRWNRPIYDIVDGTPAPAGREPRAAGRPDRSSTSSRTRPSTTASLRMLAGDDRPVWTKMSFAAAEHNFTDVRPPGHRRARSTGPASARSPADELVLRHLLPLAHEGLERWGVSAAVRDRYLGVIEGRCTRARNGASWQIDTVERLEERGADRRRALQRDARALHRGHARQRAGAHLGGALSGSPRYTGSARRPPGDRCRGGGLS